MCSGAMDIHGWISMDMLRYPWPVSTYIFWILGGVGICFLIFWWFRFSIFGSFSGIDVGFLIFGGFGISFLSFGGFDIRFLIFGRFDIRIWISASSLA